MNAFLRIFGAGPLGVLLTAGFIALAVAARSRFPGGALGLPAPLRYGILVCAVLATSLGVAWSFRSLPVAQRGRALSVQGAYRLVRHPLYASFITLGAPGLALFFDHAVFLLWLPFLHVIWHLIIPLEERLMLARFGDEYRTYASHTGRFIPRFRYQTAA